METNTLIKKSLKFFKEKNFSKIEPTGLLNPSFGYTFTPSAGHQIIDEIIKLKKPIETKKFSVIERCLRELDISRVGVSNRHLSFFEMAAFGYVGHEVPREQACKEMYDYLVNVLGLDKNKLFITTFGSGKIENLDFKKTPEEDEEFYNIWRKILSQNQVKKTAGRRNFFFTKRENNPGGTGVEIYYKIGEEYIEIASQVNYRFRYINKELRKATNQAIGQGVGVERVIMALQDKKSVYDIDLIIPLKELVIKHMGNGTAKLFEDTINIIADQARAVTFVFADGQKLDQSSRGKTLRKMLRAIHSECFYLGIYDNEIYKELVDNIVELYEKRYPFLIKKKEKILREILDYYKEKFEG